MGRAAVFHSYRNHFLIATPVLLDPYFFHSVTYICEHTPEGAMGIVINHPLDVCLNEVLHHMKLINSNIKANQIAVLAGGPVQPERGFVIHRPSKQHWQSSLQVAKDIAVTTSKDILEAISKNAGPKDIIIALGYAGWEPGRLEKEVVKNSWLCTPATSGILFDIPSQDKWRASAQLIGINNISQMSFLSGHG